MVRPRLLSGDLKVTDTLKELLVKETEHLHWFDLIHDLSTWKMEYVSGEGKEKKFRLYEKTELGFCFKGNCVGANAGEAFVKQAKEKDALFTVNIRSIF